jgi:hypothetical protein
MSVEPEAQCLSDEREADPFLFETYAVSEVVFDEIDIALAFSSVRWGSGSDVRLGSLAHCRRCSSRVSRSISIDCTAGSRSRKRLRIAKPCVSMSPQ